MGRPVRKRMSNPLLTPAQRRELKERARQEHESSLLFDRKRFFIKRAKDYHPNMRAHVKAIKLLYNELRKIWEERKKSGEPQLYSARFFDLVAVESDLAVYEYVDAPTVREHIRSGGERWKTVQKAFNQLNADFTKACDAFDFGKRKGLVEADGETFFVWDDFRRENVLFEGFEEGKPKFVLADPVSEDYFE